MAFSDVPLDWRRVERESAYAAQLFHQLFTPVLLSVCGIHKQGPNDLIEDSVQEAFLTAFKEQPRLENTAKLRAWLVTTAHRKYLDRQREEKRHRKHVLASWFSSLWKHKTAEGDPAYQAEQADRCAKLVDAISQLDERDRTLVHLRSLGLLADEEIAAALNVSLSHLRVLIHRAREKLRRLLRGTPDDAK